MANQPLNVAIADVLALYRGSVVDAADALPGLLDEAGYEIIEKDTQGGSPTPQAPEIARLREEMLTVAAGLDFVISGGCDQASNLARLRDHLRREASTPEKDTPWDGRHDPTGADHLAESVRFAALGQQLYESLRRCVAQTDDEGTLRQKALHAWESRP